MKHATMSALILAAAFAVAGCASTAAPHDDHHSAPKAIDGLTSITPSANYPLKTCLVMENSPLGAKPLAYSYQGREVQFCCPGCAQAFANAPQKYMARLNAK